MIQTDVTVVDKKMVAPAWWEMTIAGPGLTPHPQPGQFLLLRCDDCYTRRPIFPSAISKETFTLLLRPNPDPGFAWLLARQPDDRLNVIGPLGTGFPLPEHTKNFLLVNDGSLANGLSIGPLLAQMATALAADYAVTLALGGRRATALYPLSALPPIVECQAATLDGSLGHKGSVLDLTPALLGWADVVCAVGSTSLYHALCAQTREVRFGNDRGFLFGLLPSRNLLCGVGACLSCVIETERGYQLACLEGPVVDLLTIEWGMND